MVSNDCVRALYSRIPFDLKYSLKFYFIHRLLQCEVPFIHRLVGLKGFEHFSLPHGLHACKFQWSCLRCDPIILDIHQSGYLFLIMRGK